jgi:hypothetical protein
MSFNLAYNTNPRVYKSECTTTQELIQLHKYESNLYKIRNIIQCLQWPMFWAFIIIAARFFLSANAHIQHQKKKPTPTANLSIKSGFTSQIQSFSMISLSICLSLNYDQIFFTDLSSHNELHHINTKEIRQLP